LRQFQLGLLPQTILPYSGTILGPCYLVLDPTYRRSIFAFMILITIHKFNIERKWLEFIKNTYFGKL